MGRLGLPEMLGRQASIAKGCHRPHSAMVGERSERAVFH
jgi:hypothetical protein